MSSKQFRVWCETDGRYEHTWSVEVPTACPVDPGHTITAEKTAAVDNALQQSPKAYDAVVDVGGEGDYDSIRAAFEAGEKSVFVRPGVYVETGDIIIPEDGVLTAVAPGSVMVVFAGPFSVKIDGSARSTNAGTVSVAHGGQIITGVGTAFTTLVDKDFIRLGAHWHQIASVDSDLQVTLLNPYNGKALTDVTYEAQSMILGASMSGIVIYGSTKQGLIVRQAMNVAIQKCYVTGNGEAGAVENALVEKSAEIFFLGTLVKNGPFIGLIVRDSFAFQAATCSFSNNALCGLVLAGVTMDTIIDACVMLQNGQCGITITDNAKRANVTDSIFHQNNDRGVNTHVSTEGTVVDSCTVTENQTAGIEFAGTRNVVSNNVVADNGQQGIVAGAYGAVVGNHVSGNGGVGIDAGDSDCMVSTNVVYDNSSDGIKAGSDSAITTNRVHSNNGHGVKIEGGVNDAIVTNNNLKGNTSGGIDDSGSGTIATNNKV